MADFRPMPMPNVRGMAMLQNLGDRRRSSADMSIMGSEMCSRAITTSAAMAERKVLENGSRCSGATDDASIRMCKEGTPA